MTTTDERTISADPVPAFTHTPRADCWLVTCNRCGQQHEAADQVAGANWVHHHYQDEHAPGSRTWRTVDLPGGWQVTGVRRVWYPVRPDGRWLPEWPTIGDATRVALGLTSTDDLPHTCTTCGRGTVNDDICINFDCPRNQTRN